MVKDCKHEIILIQGNDEKFTCSECGYHPSGINMEFYDRKDGYFQLVKP